MNGPYVCQLWCQDKSIKSFLTLDLAIFFFVFKLLAAELFVKNMGQRQTSVHLAKFVGTAAALHWYQGDVSYGDNGRMQRPLEASLRPPPASRRASWDGWWDFGVGRVEKSGPMVFGSNTSSYEPMTMTTQIFFLEKYWQLSWRINHWTSQQETIHGSRKNPPSHNPRFTSSFPAASPPRKGLEEGGWLPFPSSFWNWYLEMHKIAKLTPQRRSVPETLTSSCSKTWW